MWCNNHNTFLIHECIMYTNIIFKIYTLKMLCCFNPTSDQIWTNPNVGLKNVIKKCNPMAGFVHIWPKVGLKQPSIFWSVYIYICVCVCVCVCVLYNLLPWNTFKYRNIMNFLFINITVLKSYTTQHFTTYYFNSGLTLKKKSSNLNLIWYFIWYDIIDMVY